VLTRRPDKGLRRAVADLAALTTEDIQAVLAGLEERQRESIEALLASYRGEPARSVSVVHLEQQTGESIAIIGLSPWLAARIERRSQSESSRPGAFAAMSGVEAREAGMAYTITPTAFEALRTSAARLQRETSADVNERPSVGGARAKSAGTRFPIRRPKP